MLFWKLVCLLMVKIKKLIKKILNILIGINLYIQLLKHVNFIDVFLQEKTIDVH